MGFYGIWGAFYYMYISVIVLNVNLIGKLASEAYLIGF
jgi:hypothetical protein